MHDMGMITPHAPYPRISLPINVELRSSCMGGREFSPPSPLDVSVFAEVPPCCMGGHVRS